MTEEEKKLLKTFETQLRHLIYIHDELKRGYWSDQHIRRKKYLYLCKVSSDIRNSNSNLFLETYYVEDISNLRRPRRIAAESISHSIPRPASFCISRSTNFRQTKISPTWWLTVPALPIFKTKSGCTWRIIGQNSVKHWEDKLADARQGLSNYLNVLKERIW